MLGFIKTEQLFLFINPKETKLLECTKESTEHAHSPGSNGHDTNKLSSEELASTTIEDTSFVNTKDTLDIFTLGHETDPKDAESATESVHRGSFKRVINLQLEEKSTRVLNTDSTEHATDDSCPWFSGGASRSNSHETSQSAVTHGDEIPNLVRLVVESHSGETTRSCGESCGHSRASNDLRIVFTHQSQLRTWVETVPANPKNECTENNKRSGVTRHRINSSIFGETTSAWTNHIGPHKTSETTDHVDNTRTSKVQHTDTKELRTVFTPWTKPAFSGPAPMYNTRIDECRQKE